MDEVTSGLVLSAAILSVIVGLVVTKLSIFIPDSWVEWYYYTLPETKQFQLDSLAWVLTFYPENDTPINNLDREVLNQLLEEGYWERFKKNPNRTSGYNTVVRYREWASPVTERSPAYRQVYLPPAAYYVSEVDGAE